MVKHRGSFTKIRLEARQAIVQGMRDLTREVYVSVQQETPTRTGRLRRGWQVETSNLRGVVGNTESHAPVVALGRRDRPMSAKERRNVGFHERAIEMAARNLERLFREAFRRLF